VLTPQEIANIRARHGYSRTDFAKLTLLGAASLARWEKGLLIQNPGNDQLLYLMRFKDNVERLLARRREGAQEQAEYAAEITASCIFRALQRTPSLEQEAASFSLRLN
jgi:transcriptional regulator with XRE-family HTH domain